MFVSVSCRWLTLAPMGLVLAACASAQTPAPAPEPLSAPSTRSYTQQLFDLYLRINPMCPRSSVADESEAYAPARAAFDQYRRSIDGSAEAALFDAGVEEVHHWETLVDINCQTPGNDSTETLRSKVLDETQRALAALRHSAKD